MKIFYLVALLSAITTLTAAQRLFEPAPGSYGIDPHAQLHSGSSRDVIWSEDFSSGFSSGWTSYANGGVASWEYRGTTTTPTMEVGSRGSCVVGNLGEPIMSPTAANGFMIFDSNWWDNPSLPCSQDNFGTGPAPGPHYATLTSPVIDLSAYSSVAIQFNQYLKVLTGETRVEVTVDGVNWLTVFVNSALPNPTTPIDLHVIQISSYVANQPYVQIRFAFDAQYYFWQLDDVQIIDTYSNDMEIGAYNYGDFNLLDPTHPTGYEYMQYSKYPTTMAPDLKFSAEAINVGGGVQTDCRLNVDVISHPSGAIIHQASSIEGFPIYSGQTQQLRAGNFQMPATSGEYKLAYEVDQFEEDESLLNNRDTTYFYINDVQYARDRIFASAVYLGTPDYTDVEYELGNVFLITANNHSCHSITVGVGIGSSTPATIEGRLYRFDIATGVQADFIAATQPIEITSAMLNGYGDQILTNLVFDTAVPLDSGQSYFVAVASSNGVDNFVCAMAGSAEEGTALVRYFPQDWYYLDMLPMVRMNFGPYNAVNEIKSIADVRVYPNPADDAVVVELPAAVRDVFSVQWFDARGTLVRQEQFNSAGQLQYRPSLEGLPSGMYQLVMHGESNHFQTTIIRR